MTEKPTEITEFLDKKPNNKRLYRLLAAFAVGAAFVGWDRFTGERTQQIAIEGITNEAGGFLYWTRAD